MKSGLRRLLLAVVILGVLAYVAAAIHLVTQETTLIFQPADARADSRPAFPYEEIDLARQDRARQFAWIMRQDPGQGKRDKGEGKSHNGDLWVLYLHGNASTIASRMNVAHYGRIRALGLNLFAPEYRGYNGLDGRLSELSLNVDARAAYRPFAHVRPRACRSHRHFRVVARRSRRGRPRLAGVGACGHPRRSARIDRRAGPAAVPFFPIRWLIRNRFEPIRKVAGIRAPMLFLHSPDDQVIPIEQGRKLFDAAPTPKTFVEVRGGHIEASEIDADRFYGTIREFLGKIGTGERD